MIKAIIGEIERQLEAPEEESRGVGERGEAGPRPRGRGREEGRKREWTRRKLSSELQCTVTANQQQLKYS